MVKHTRTIYRLLPTNYVSMFELFVGLARKGLRTCQTAVIKSPAKIVKQLKVVNNFC